MRGLKLYYQGSEERNPQSHPTWVRGLKLDVKDALRLDEMSHPTWVRGLKLSLNHADRVLSLVAPYVGAWIET